MGRNISGLVKEALFGSENILMDVGEGKRCSAFAAGKDATVDGSTINAYTCDGPCDFRLELIPAAAHEAGEEYIIDYKGIKGGSGHTAEGKIPEVPYTNAIFSAEVPVANASRQVIRKEAATNSFPVKPAATTYAAMVCTAPLAEIRLPETAASITAITITPKMGLLKP